MTTTPLPALIAASVPVQSIVIDLVITTRAGLVGSSGPKSPLPTPLSSPFGSVASWAAWKVAHGAARVQALPPPVDDTQVRGMAPAGVAARSPAMAKEAVTKVFMERSLFQAEHRGRRTV